MFDKLPQPAPDQPTPRPPAVSPQAQETIGYLVAAIQQSDVVKWLESRMNQDLGSKD